MNYAKKVMRCPNITKQTPGLLEPILRKGLGDDLQINEMHQETDEIIFKGNFEGIGFTIYLNRTDESVLLELDRSEDVETYKNNREEYLKAYRKFNKLLEDKIVLYEPVARFDVQYPSHYLINNNKVEKVMANKFVTLFLNVSAPNLTHSYYLSRSLNVRYDLLFDSWFLGGDTQIDNLEYNPKYRASVGKIKILDILSMRGEREKQLVGGRKNLSQERV